MLRIGRIGVGVALGIALCGAPVCAAAEPSAPDAARLPELLRAGADAAKAKRWEACADALTAAARIDEAATPLGELGLCEEAAGRYALAFTHLRRAMEKAPPDLSKEPWKRYSAALERLTARVALLFITTDPPHARVVVDGRPQGLADGHEVAVEPGTHTIAARLDGYEDTIVERSVHAHDKPSVHLALKAKPSAPAVATAAPRAPVSPPRSAPQAPRAPAAPELPWYRPAVSLRGGLLAATGAGLLATLVTLGVSVGAEVRRGELVRGLASSACNPANPSPPSSCAPLHDAAVLRNSTAAGALGAAGATVVLGGLLAGSVFLERRQWRPTIAVTVGDKGGGLAVSGAW
jgi:hypothetical protein